MGDDDIRATPDGLLHCLRMLTEEAALLRLDRTFAALKDALELCYIEASAGSDGHGAMPTSLAVH